MKSGRLLWRIYFYFLAAAWATLALATGQAVHTLRQFHKEQVERHLTAKARLAAHALQALSPEQDPDAIARFCADAGKLADARLTVILPNGTVIGESERGPADMDNHADRPEITEAFRGGLGTAERYSDTLKRRLLYTAVPIQRDGVIVAVARIAQPLADIRWDQRAIVRQLVVRGLFVSALFALVALGLSRRITQPLEEMRRVAERLAQQDFSARVAAPPAGEIGALARTLNDMAEQLGDRMDTIVRQQVEQQAVLTCMVEGVIAVDPEGRLLYLNESAGRLLDIATDRARGRSIQEAVRHRPAQEFIAATLTNDGPSEAEILVHGASERHVQLHGTPLVDPTGRRIGGLAVVNDITRLKRLERVRSDFVANVSHELKTPITALKGCVETLGGGTPVSSGDTARFTSMMARQVQRLEAIVEDLLSLARLEFDGDQGGVERATVSVAELLRRVAQAFAEPAQAKGITLTVKCPENLQATVNSPLLEQALGNLVDNAIKYSGEGTRVLLAATQSADRLELEVADQGQGMEKKHLPRIFERFYRVDTARSRAMGGTGLGLAIVKHIALAHQGTVEVESAPGQGSTFTLRLPLES